MRRDTQWLLMPRLTALAAFGYVMLVALERAGWWLRGVASAPSTPGMAYPSYMIPVFFAALYGFGRMLTFHPSFNDRYRKWLETAPWHPGMPLPLGPVELGLRDLLVLAPAAALAHYVSGGPAMGPPLIFGVCYLFSMLAPLADKGWWAFSLMVGFAGLFRAAPYPPVMAALVVAMYAVARMGLKHSLPRPGAKKPDPPSATNLGAPFEQLAPVPPPKPIPLPHAVAYAALVGWWAYALCGSLGREMKRGDVVIMTSFAGAAVALIRFSTYAIGSEAPLGLRARWVTRRWIVPGYDQILVAPLVVFAAAAGLPWALAKTVDSVALVAGVSGAIVLLLALALPPTRARWLLTGHRHIPRLRSGAGKLIKVTA